METQMQDQIDIIGQHYFSRFNEFAAQDDLDTCKAIMDEWIVDGVDPDDGGVEFIWLDQIEA